MDTQIAFTAISSLISIIGIWYLLFWRYHKLCMDAFRQRTFEMRDELFDYAADGNIDFQHPAYGLLRKMMNGFIRFGHHFSAWQGVLFLVLTSKEDKDYLKSRSFRVAWTRVTRDLDPSVKARLDQFVSQLESVAAHYFFLSSPHSFLLAFPLMLIAVLRDRDLLREAIERGGEKLPASVRLRLQTRYENKCTANHSRVVISYRPFKVKQILGEVAVLYGEQSPSAKNAPTSATLA